MKKYIFILAILLSFHLLVNGQINSRNGCNFPSQGTLRVFVIFAETVNDPADPGAMWFDAVDSWQPGSLPTNKDKIIDHTFTNEASIKGFITKYFYDASFANLIVIGDYYPNLVQVNYNDLLTSMEGETEIQRILQNTNGNDIITKNGYSINSHFDSWTLTSSYNPKINNSDGYIDLILVFWRNCPSGDINHSNRSGGFVSTSKRNIVIKQKFGYNAYSSICSTDLCGTFRHEFAHPLLGDNNYHSGRAGAGVGTFLSDFGGYSLLQSTSANLNSVNGWDRDRLGWKPSANQYYISARNNSNVEVNGDLIYGQNLSSNEFILRDFTTYGDAIRVKLPFIKSINSSTKNQYIWMENHQLLSNKIEYDINKQKGIRLNLQVGNDVLTTVFNSSTTNYISPVCSFGNYDFSFSNINSDIVGIASYEYSNPLTGYSLLENYAYDKDSDNKILNTEHIGLKRVSLNGNDLGIEYPLFAAGVYDIFPIGSKIGINTNPTLSARVTHRVADRYYKNQLPVNIANDDNRYIYLNGLSIEVLEQRADGSIKVRIKWNDFDVDNNVRWCGPIVLNERINLKSGYSITLDQCLTPTKPQNPQTFNGQKVFADPTIFTSKSGSNFILEEGSSVIVKNNSALVLESGANMEVRKGSKLIVKAGSTLQIKAGANLKVYENGFIEIENGAYICIETGANVLLNNTPSVINLITGYMNGVNTSVLPSSSTCQTNITYSGSGVINKNISRDVLYIQNTIINTDKYYIGRNIYAGYSVYPSYPYGNVVIKTGKFVYFNTEDRFELYPGFEVEDGATMEVITK